MSIQNGEGGSVPALWGQVRNFVARQANRLVLALDGRCGVTVDDLINEGFLAMCAACETYNDDKGGFITWLDFYLKRSFAAACGYRTSRRDAIDLSDSLDRPLDHSDADSDTLGAVIPDPRNQYDAVDNAVYNEGLHVRLDALIGTLTPAGAEMIRDAYWKGKTTEQLARDRGITERAVGRRREDYIQNLRRQARCTSAGLRLCAYIEVNTPYYTHVGPRQFNTTHTSAVEKAVLVRERIEREFRRKEK